MSRCPGAPLRPRVFLVLRSVGWLQNRRKKFESGVMEKSSDKGNKKDKPGDGSCLDAISGLDKWSLFKLQQRTYLPVKNGLSEQAREYIAMRKAKRDDVVAFMATIFDLNLEISQKVLCFEACEFLPDIAVVSPGAVSVQRKELENLVSRVGAISISGEAIATKK